MQIIVKAVIGGQVISVLINVEPDCTIKGAIAEFCQKIDIPVTNNIQMKDDTGLMLTKESSVAQAGIHDGDTVFILQSGHSSDEGNSEDNSGPTHETKDGQRNCNILVLVIGFVLVTASICGTIGLSMKFTEEICINEGYGAVFDAGSSHTNLTIYSWPRKSMIAGTGSVTQEATCRSPGGGISSYEDTPQDAGPSLTSCLENIKDIVPENYYDYTYLSLGATAGMRLLQKTRPSTSNAILMSVRQTMASYPFNFSSNQASIISGEDEGTYGWVSANILSGTLQPTSSFLATFTPSLQPEPNSTYGVLDLGGASTQITFHPEDPSSLPSKYKKHLRLYGIEYTLYTHSYLCYGINEAIRRFKANLVKDADYSTTVTNPCAPSGFSETVDGEYLWKAPCSTGPQALAGWGSEVTPPFGAENSTVFNLTGTSDLERCQKAVENLFNFTAPCPIKPCSFNGVYQPQPSGNFLAFSTFEKLIAGLGLPPTASIEEIQNATHTLCAKTYDEIKKMSGNLEYLVLYCFEINFVSTLLQQGYHFNKTTWKIKFTGEVKGQELGWSLGFMIDATNMIPTEAFCSDFSRVGFYVGVGVLSVTFIIGLVVLVYSIYRCTKQKPEGGYQEMNSEYQQNTHAPYGSV